MGCYSGRIIKKWLALENEIDYNEESGQCVFSKCRKVKPKSLNIYAKQTKHNWQVGFFDADGEVQFDRIDIGIFACFSSIVRNYWWNGKRGNKKKEGYYSLIKSVKQLEIDGKYVNDFLDYVEGRYEVGKHWQIHELDRNMELRIYNILEETTVERLSRYFDNICFDEITTDLKTVNNITYNCEWYQFKNSKGVVPQKLVINTAVEHICFADTDNEVYIPEIVMEEKADFRCVIQNQHGYKDYSILPHVETLVIRNNQNVLCDLMDYINRKYKINNENDDYRSRATRRTRFVRALLSKLGYNINLNHFIYNHDDDNDNLQLHQLNKNMKIVIEKPGIAFGVVKEISDYFADVMVDDNKPEEYLTRQKPYQKSFQEHFAKYYLETDQIRNLILVSQKLQLKGEKFNLGGNNRKINLLHVNQKLALQQFICFHDTDKPVTIDKIVIEDGGDLRCVLQNAYYNGMDAGFFSLLEEAKNLDIKNNKQTMEDLADYVNGKYALHPKWGIQALNKNMVVKIHHDSKAFSLDVVRKIRNYFRSVSIDRIQALLETENVIDQECEDKYIFSNCRDVNPQKLVVNAKLAGNEDLMLFDDANGEIYIPEITIGEHGSFDVIVRNKWQNNKNGNENKEDNYSLVSHVETLIIQNNPEAVCDLDKYVSGDYWARSYRWKVQKLSKNIIVKINGVKNLDKQINKLQKYFGHIVIDDRKALGNQRREALINIQFDCDKIQQQSTANADKHSTIARADAEIAETRRRIERARARLGRRRARFQEYLALVE